jgi:hypothetical protein
VTAVFYQLAVDWDDDGSFGTSGDDVTPRWLWGQGLSASRGRDRASQLVGRSTAGRFSCTLDNSDARFSSFETGSPLYGKVLPGRKLRLVAYALPSQIADLAAWFRADALALTDGAAVATWADSSGNGRDGTQGTAGQRPVYKTGIVNGLPVVRFDGVDDNLAVDALASLFNGNDAPGSVFAVLKQSSTAGTQEVLALDSAGSAQFQAGYSAGWRVRRRDDAATAKSQTGGTSDTTTFHIVTWTAAAAANIWKDGAQVVTAGDVDVGTSTFTRGRIGKLAAGGEFLAGDLAELIVFTRVLSSFQRKLVEAYLSVKYALGSLEYALWGGFLDTLSPKPAAKGPKTADLSASGPLAYLNDPKKTISTPIHTAILTGAAIGDLLDEAGWPAGDRSLDAGQTTMSRWWQETGTPLAGLRAVEDTDAGFLYESPARKVVFEDRHHRLIAPHTVPQAVYSDALGASLNYYAIEQIDPWDEIYNRFEATIQLYTVGALAVLWQMPVTAATTPRLAPGASATFVAHYPTKDAPNDDVGVDAWTTPVATTDFLANANAFGVGADLTGSITVAVSKNGNDMEITLTNSGATTAYITFLRARGTPVAAEHPIKIPREDTASQATYGIRTFPNPAKFVPSVDEAEGWGDWAKAIYKDPLPWLKVTLWGNVSDACMEECLTRQISDRVSVVADGDAGLGVNEDFFVEAIEHKITAGQHFTTFTLSPAVRFSDAFVLGVSRLGSTTRLAY